MDNEDEAISRHYDSMHDEPDDGPPECCECGADATWTDSRGNHRCDSKWCRPQRLVDIYRGEVE